MNLLQELKKVNNLNSKTIMKVICNDGIVVEGTFYGFTSALDNEPEIAQLEILNTRNDGLVGILETEIQSIEVANKNGE